MNDQYTKTRLQRSSYFLHTLVANGWWARISVNLTQEFKFSVTMIQSVLKISVVKIYLNYTSTRQSPLQVGQIAALLFVNYVIVYVILYNESNLKIYQILSLKAGRGNGPKIRCCLSNA